MILTGKTILVTEDEPDQMDFIRTVLSDNGATVLEAQNGNEAVAGAFEHKPDLLTLDITMPGLDVMEVLEHLANDGDLNGLKVCIISGRPELRGVLFDTAPIKLAGYVDKPFTEETLLATVRTILGV